MSFGQDKKENKPANESELKLKRPASKPVKTIKKIRPTKKRKKKKSSSSSATLIDEPLYTIKELRTKPTMAIKRAKSTLVYVRVPKGQQLPPLKEQIFVLDKLQKNIIASLLVIKHSSRSKTLFIARITQRLKTIKGTQLIGHQVIRFSDFVPGDGPDNTAVKPPVDPTTTLPPAATPLTNAEKFLHNPLVEAGVGLSSFKFVSADVLTGATLNAATSALRLETALFLPYLAPTPWLNWIGFIFRSDTYEQTELSLQTANTENIQKAVLTGSSQDLFFVFKPLLPWKILSSVYLIQGLSQTRNEKVELKETTTAPRSELEMSVSGAQTAIGFESSPFAYVQINLRFWILGDMNYEAQEVGSSAEGQKGVWRRTDTEVLAKFRYPIIPQTTFYGYASGGFIYRQDSISNTVVNGSKKTLDSNDSVFFGTLGLGYIL